MCFNSPYDAGNNPVREAGAVGDGRGPNDCPSVNIILPHLRNGDIEVVSYPLQKGLDNSPLLFQRGHLRQQQTASDNNRNQGETR